jgi:hypothetical protein
MRSKSLLTEARQIDRAITLIQLGARLQVLESETDLSYERLLRLYKEVSGKSPSKGQLPFSTDWFMTWQPNIHASLFLNIHEYLNKVPRSTRSTPSSRPIASTLSRPNRKGSKHCCPSHAPGAW